MQNKVKYKISDIIVSSTYVLPVEVVSETELFITYNRLDGLFDNTKPIKRKKVGQFFDSFEHAKDAIIKRLNSRINRNHHEIDELIDSIETVRKMGPPKIKMREVCDE